MGTQSTPDFGFELRHWNPQPRLYQKILCATVVGYSRFVMRTLNSVEFREREHWDKAFEFAGRGVLSFSNHVSLFDDPLLVSNLGRVKFDDVRWIGADHKNFYGSALKGFISAAGKCVPIMRGAGLDQPGLAFLTECLRNGHWVHIFPEGGRTRDPDARMRTPFKQGIGKLIAEARPILAPFYHYGMHRVLPIGKTMPSRGQSVQVLFGQHTEPTDEWLETVCLNADPSQSFQTLADWAYNELRTLEVRLHPEP